MEYHDKSRVNEEKKKNKVISLKLLFGHFRLGKFQEGLEKNTPLTWKAQAALYKLIAELRRPEGLPSGAP